MGEGFILTRRRFESAGSIYLEYWLSCDQGPVKIITSNQQEVFFVRQKDKKTITQLLDSHLIDYEYKDLALTNFSEEKIAGLYFSTMDNTHQAKEKLKHANIDRFEYDIRLTERFLMERFIYGGAQFSGIITGQPTRSKIAHSKFAVYENAQLKSSHYKPSFKVLSLDIECSEQGELYSIGLASKNYQCVLIIGNKEQHAPPWVKWVKDERALLNSLINEVETYDPDIFIGWNVINFDFNLLIKRAARYRIALRLGRDQRAISWRKVRGDSGQGYVSMHGRIIIDGIDGLKTATYHFDSFSLEFVAQALLGKGKKTDDVENRMAAINYDFQYNKIKLAEYNIQDCLLVLDIFEHTRLLDFLILRSQLTGLELDRAGGSVAAFLNLYLPKLHRAGYISPNRPDDGGLASPGGYVMDSTPGLYRHVLVLDFKSLYPSIIRTFKIDPLGLVLGLQGDPEQGIPGYKGAVFSRDTHFLPQIITDLWQQRDEAKHQHDSARSQAIKILMNSFYGVLGSGGCPFYDTRLASSITMRGHDIIQTTAKWIKQQGYQVIYGDTDSIFVWLEGELNDKDAETIGNRLQKEINAQWVSLIRNNYQLESHLELEFETHFSHFLMPTIRGSTKGSKKRYAGIKDGVLIFKGLENVRSDWTPLAKLFQHQLYSKVFSGERVNEYLCQIIADLRLGQYDQKLVYRKRLRRPLSHYVKNVPPHVKAARLADTLNEKYSKPLQYQNRGWISYIITTNGPEPLSYLSSPIDYDHYVEKQIKPIAEGILPFIDVSFEKITSSQLGLF